MSDKRMVKVNLEVVRQLVRLIDRMQEKLCLGCSGEDHEVDCPANGTVQLRNYLTLRLNHPREDFTI